MQPHCWRQGLPWQHIGYPLTPVLCTSFSAICVAYKSIAFLKQIQATVLQLHYVKSYLFNLLSAVLFFQMLSHISFSAFRSVPDTDDPYWKFQYVEWFQL